MKTIANICKNEQSAGWYADILTSIFGDSVKIKFYCLDENNTPKIEKSDLYIMNAVAYSKDCFVCLEENKLVIPNLTLFKSAITMLNEIPNGTDVLIVNRNLKMSMDTISNLLRICGFSLNFYPYAPGEKTYHQCQIAVVVACPELAPKECTQIIDIGARVFQATTIAEIALKLGMPEVLTSKAYMDYVDKLAMRSYSVDNLCGQISKLSDDKKTSKSQVYKKGNSSKYTFDDIIGECPEILKAKDIAKKIAATNVSVLITGESGTGKELFAHSIHNSSQRSHMPFIAVNCAALSETLLESELFGYVEGAFTGAKKGGKVGLFEYANGGTLFFDEVEAMSQNLQVKLLRVLQEKEITRVGGNETIPVDVRIIAASNENIDIMVQNGTFRKDLYYRINAFPIEIPPLRKRKEDIFLLLDNFKNRLGANFSLSPQAEEVLQNYKWDGNVRELINLVEYFKYMSNHDIGKNDLPKQFLSVDKSVNSVLTDFYSIAGKKKEQCLFILTTLKNSENTTIVPGRRQIATLAAMQGFSLSEQEIRSLSAILLEGEFIYALPNKRGFALTTKGFLLLDEIYLG